MKTITITKADLNSDNEYQGDVSNVCAHIEIEADLGLVKFKSILTTGRIRSQAGTGIKADWGIKAGLGIEAGWGIKAGWGIEAGWDIKAGDGIKAGWGVKAGWGINCNKILTSGLRIFAGLCLWREPTNDELKITCGKLEKGKICFGELVETGLIDNEQEEKKESVDC